MIRKLSYYLVRLVRILKGRDIPVFPIQRYTLVSYGVQGARWCIHPASLNPNPLVLSFGIGTDISFDLAMISNHNARVIAFDPTPASLNWLAGLNLPVAFSYYPYGLSDSSGKTKFYVPVVKEHISHSLQSPGYSENEFIEVEMKTFHDLLELTGTTGHALDLLKMDIEGAEYKVIDQLCDLRPLPVQVLIEFHHRFPNTGLKATRKAIRKLKKAGYKIVFVSENGEEYSFLRGRETKK